ncbi:acyl-CoA thioesterase [Thalassorhabdomicrobium marinisediminis]|uniref:acyl-CoA thioesterase n=1 Tax=Thalassorhabdomicrobium marinisediminis TaxID=2170577 RepID=UPI00248F8198|nr:thioesterase family protein [Thalassorhabdomicrobium marinisediminis]
MSDPQDARPLPFATQEPLRFRDMDPLGHINNSVYSTLLEQNRIAFQDQPGGFREARGQSAVLATQTIDFVREMRWPGTAEVRLGIGRLGRSSIQIHQEISFEGALIARARCTQVLIDDTTRKAVPLSDEQRTMLAPWMVDAQDG